MSSSQKQTTHQTQSQTSSNTIDPTQMGQYQANYNTAQNNAAQLGTPYTGQLVAGLTPTQVQAMGQLSNVATNPNYTGALGGATSALQGALGSLPSGQINATPVNASTIANSDLSQYMNQFQNSVINATMNQYGQMNANQLNQTNQSATASGAFGGSRSGVADALTNQYVAQQEAPVLAQLNASNYTNAQNAAAQDAATKNAIGEFNSGQNLTAQQNSVQNALNSSAMAGNLAGQIGNLTNANYAMAANQGGLLASVGQQQQAQQQNELSAAYQNWLQGKQLTMDQQTMLNQALSMIPIQQTTNGSGTQDGTTTTTQNPGAAGILGALGSAAAGIGMMSMGMPGGLGALGGLMGGGGGGALGAVSMPSMASLPMMSMPSTVFPQGGIPGYFGSQQQPY